MSFPAGTRIGAYEIVSLLGAGGMGVVYRAHDERLDRDVALKVLPRDTLADETARARLLREARLASKLNHPHVCTIYEVGEADPSTVREPQGRPEQGRGATGSGQTVAYIAMELVEGQTLSARLSGGPMPVEQVVRYGQQLAAALAHAHGRGVVHRDLKSGNIIITGDGRIKVLDFGLAKRMGVEAAADAEACTETALTAPGAITGTPAYMAPEQLRGEPADARSDIWALGVVLYEMAGGRRPFQGKSSFELMAAILSGSLSPLPPAVPGPLKAVINRCLAQDPADRYQHASEVGEALNSLLPDAAASLDVKRLIQRLRRPRVALPAAAGVIALVALLIWFFDHQAKVRWARQEALPQIEKLIAANDVWRDLTPAFRLAEKAEAYIPRDPKLAELLSKCSLRINVRTEPPGASVYFKEYKSPESEWLYLGVSPLEKVRVPIGIFRWKMEKDGYDTVLAASSTWDIDVAKHDIIIPYTLARVLDRKGVIPPGMVRVPELETPDGKTASFYIDKCEVTNREYKDFINNGAYRKKEYWKYPFVNGGRELSWEEAISELVDQTGQPGPATWQAGDYPDGQADFPVSGVSWYEAAAYAEYAGKSLPTGSHWAMARGEGTPLVAYPQLGGFAAFAPFSNFNGKGALAVGTLPGISVYGAFDMAGNVREWCWNETPQGRLIRGGAWGDNTYMSGELAQAPAMDRSPRNGFRCALYPDRTKVPASALQPVTPGGTRDYYSDKPVSDAIFVVYREQFSYDQGDLKPRVEAREASPGGWIREKVSFNAAYGGERVSAYLFLPKNAPPPYQTVIYFPGSASVVQRSSNNLESYYEFPMFLSFIVKSGRAAVYPVYKGTFERGDPALIPIHGGANTHLYTEYLVQLVKDFRRCVDYLESRPDIDSRKLAYYGMSWGGTLGGVIPAVEERLRASVIVAGGLMAVARPEANEINYVTRVRIPTLMLGGKYDTILTSAKPMFDLLGTPAKDKQLKLYDTDHIPPRNEMIKETLAWLDRYLGPVR